MKSKIIVLAFIFTVGFLKAQEVKINNNFVVESDGTVRLDGAATLFEDVLVFPDATSKMGSNPPVMGTRFLRNATGTSQGVFLWMFSPTAEQELYFSVQLPHSYKVGSTIFPHVHWTTVTGVPSGTNVVWGLEYTAIAIGGNFPNTTILTSNSLIPTIPIVTGTGQHLITPLGSIPGTDLGISTVLICRVYRLATDVSDTFGNDVGLLGIDFHIEKDTEGSRQEYVK